MAVVAELGHLQGQVVLGRQAISRRKWPNVGGDSQLLSIVGQPSSTAYAPAATDWYANLLWIERRKCLVVTHAGTLFSVFVPDVQAANLRPIGRLVVPLLQAELVGDGLLPDALGALRAKEVVLARTADRSVLGSMNDMALMIESSVWADGGLRTCNVTELNRHLRRHISGARGYKPPIELARGWNQRAD